MKKRGKFSFGGFGRKRAFTLLELMLALAIGSILMAVLGNILLTSLNTSSALSRGMTRTNDDYFALQSMIDEVRGADEIYYIEQTQHPLKRADIKPPSVFHYCDHLTLKHI